MVFDCPVDDHSQLRSCRTQRALPTELLQRLQKPTPAVERKMATRAPICFSQITPPHTELISMSTFILLCAAPLLQYFTDTTFVTQGVQTVTIPMAGAWRITAYGARGGYAQAGLGA